MATEIQPATLVLSPAPLLRLEGATLLALSLVLYARSGSPWWLFVLLLSPDLSMLGYLGGKRIGAQVYNLFHSYFLPAILAVVGLLASPLVLSLALVWFAHIGLDRTLGYGLKYETDFKDTHLGRI